MRIFISSVQKEFAAERRALADYLSGDPLLRRFFETFLFERDVPASDRRPDAIYLDEVRNCDLYLGLFGDDYGWENKDGLSTTHLEFNEAILLFGKQPQRFLITSEVKCAHFHGYEVAKPIPSYQVYKGTVFDLVDQAKDFVLSKIDLWVGTREHSTQVPTKYEIPQEVVAEAIVNAVVHRDYTSNASVQVMLFKDRLEIWNPGSLPPTLTLEKLRGPHASVPHNPLLAEPMYLTKYIERMGTGIRDMIHRCRKAGLPEPEIRLDGGSFVLTVHRPATGSATPSGPGQDRGGQLESRLESRLESALAAKVMLAIRPQPLGKAAIAPILGHKSVSGELHKQIKRMVNGGLIEPTIPEKPSSRLQKYRLTARGQALLAELEKPGGNA